MSLFIYQSRRSLKVKMMSSIAPTVVFNVPLFQTITGASTLALQKVTEVIPLPTEELGEYFSYAVAKPRLWTVTET